VIYVQLSITVMARGERSRNPGTLSLTADQWWQ